MFILKVTAEFIGFLHLRGDHPMPSITDTGVFIIQNSQTQTAAVFFSHFDRVRLTFLSYFDVPLDIVGRMAYYRDDSLTHCEAIAQGAYG